MRKRETDESWDDLEYYGKGYKIGNPQVTITDKFSIFFNSAFWHKAELENKKKIKLGYSRRNNSITFEFTEDENAKDTYTLIKRGNSANSTCVSWFKKLLNKYDDLKQNEIIGAYRPCNTRIPKIGSFWYVKLNEKIDIK